MFLILHVFQCCLPYSRSYHVSLSFSYLVHFFFCHIPGSTVFVSHFLRFSVFSPLSRSLSVHFSFSMFLSVSCHIPGQKVFVSHFPHFFSFLAIFYVLQCAFITFSGFSVFLTVFQVIECLCLICHVCQFSRHNPGVLRVFFIFHVFHCIMPYSRS